MTFAVVDGGKRAVQIERFETGTEVYATERRDGTFTVRIPGTLFTQHVYLSSIEPF